jgi:uncharacterized protein
LPAFSAYERLLAKVEGHATPIETRQRKNLACREGCSGCCRSHLALAPVEARYLAEGLAELHEAARAAILKNAQALIETGAGGPCPLLVDDRCALYSRRPLICRTHGLPVTARELRERGRAFDVCPLNFTEEAPAAEDLLNLDVLNALLFTVDALYRADTGEEDARIFIAEALLGAE